MAAAVKRRPYLGPWWVALYALGLASWAAVSIVFGLELVVAISCGSVWLLAISLAALSE